jgi:hypothetical protein
MPGHNPASDQRTLATPECVLVPQRLPTPHDVHAGVVEAISIWAALLIVVLGIAVDLVLGRLDPRIRDGGLPG